MDSALRGDRDMAVEDNLTQARFELQRCAGDSDLAAWARRWGEGFCAAFAAQDVEAERDAAFDESTKFEEQVETLEAAIRKAVDAGQRLVDELAPAHGDRLAAIIDALDEEV